MAAPIESILSYVCGMPCFSGYKEIEEWRGDARLLIIKTLNKKTYKGERDNPIAYFSYIIQSFLKKKIKEQKRMPALDAIPQEDAPIGDDSLLVALEGILKWVLLSRQPAKRLAIAYWYFFPHARRKLNTRQDLANHLGLTRKVLSGQIRGLRETLRGML